MMYTMNGFEIFGMKGKERSNQVNIRKTCVTKALCTLRLVLLVVIYFSDFRN